MRAQTSAGERAKSNNTLISSLRPSRRHRMVDDATTAEHSPMCRSSSSRLACSALSRQSATPATTCSGQIQPPSVSFSSWVKPITSNPAAANHAKQVQLLAANCPAPGTQADSRKAVHLLGMANIVETIWLETEPQLAVYDNRGQPHSAPRSPVPVSGLLPPLLRWYTAVSNPNAAATTEGAPANVARQGGRYALPLAH